MWITIVLVLGYLLIPVFLIYLTHISNNLRKIGAVVLAYGVGLFVGNIGLFPRASENLRNLLAAQAAASLPEDQLMEHFNTGVITSNDLMANQIASTQESIYSIMILIAIPLLLFSLDLRRWLSLAGEALKSLFLAIVSLFAAIIIGYILWGSSIPESWKVGGMLVGVYTGGTPNLAAIIDYGSGAGAYKRTFGDFDLLFIAIRVEPGAEGCFKPRRHVVIQCQRTV